MWKYFDTVIYYVPTQFNFSATTAVFSFVDTLIKKPALKPDIMLNVQENSSEKENSPEQKEQKSNPKFEYKYDTVKEKIQSIYNKGGSVIIFDSHQTGNIDEVKEAFDAFQKDVEVPMLAFFSTKKNRYSKPFTNIWRLIELFYKKQKKTIDKRISLIVGHNAGRVELFNKRNRKRDYSCADRAFANNIGITFTTPEVFFLNNTKYTLWEWSPYVLSEPSKKSLATAKYSPPNIHDELGKMPQATQYIVIITGTPSCGKSTLAAKIKRKWDSDYDRGVIESVSENTNDTNQIIAQTTKYLKNKQSVLIDIVCENINITRIVRTAMEHSTPILILEIKTTKHTAHLLDFMKVQMTHDSNIVVKSKYDWKNYHKQYTCPLYNGIPCVRYAGFPLSIDVCDEFWYEYSY